MLSRVADANYWLGRYMERAENVARFVDVNLQLLLDWPEGEAEQWAALIATTGDDGVFRERYGRPTRANVIHFLTFDAEYGSSVISCLKAARENARSVREIISSEMWEQINKAYLFVREARETDEALDAPYDFFSAIKQASQLFVGITYLTMTHNEAWHFCRLGRLIERADKTSRIVDVKYFLLNADAGTHDLAYDDVQWAAVLKSISALEMYRKRFGRITPEHVIEFLLLDRKFPRSVRYALTKAERSLHAITGAPIDQHRTSAEQRLGRLRADVDGWRAADVMASGVHQRLDAFQSRLNAVGEGIGESFFALCDDDAFAEQTPEPPRVSGDVGQASPAGTDERAAG
jgi:uncharacterized alpha-E superfamily protein